jgi:hypothetical protein
VTRPAALLAAGAVVAAVVGVVVGLLLPHGRSAEEQGAAWRAGACAAVATWRSTPTTSPVRVMAALQAIDDPAAYRARARQEVEAVRARVAPVLAALAEPGAPARVAALRPGVDEARHDLDEALARIDAADPADPRRFALAVGGGVGDALDAERSLTDAACPSHP